MSTEPDYFDSQASAAASLKLDIEELRQAKRDGCPAFRSGRVYRHELLAWLAARQKRSQRAPAARDGVDDWFDRAEKLHGLMFAVEEAHEQRALKLGEYVRLAQATMPHVIALAQLWGVEDFDEAGFRKCWNTTLAEAARRGLSPATKQRDARRSPKTPR
jgi:hypothetical protein